MRAVGLMTHGGPEVLQVLDVPEVHAGPGEVRIRVHAAAVNPTDILARDGSRAEQQKVDPPPYVPGMDVAGIVDEVGPGVETLVRVGDAVMGMVVPKGNHGGYREQIVLGARSVARTPAGTSHIEACTLPMNGLTARLSLDLLNLAPGQVLAVTGAAGAYGGYVIQQARHDGLTVVADASDADRDLVASLGAHVVVARGPDVASRIREHFPSGVDGLADGAVLNERAVPAVRDGGAFTAVRGFQGAPQRGISSRPRSCAPTTATSRSSIACANWLRRERSPCVSLAPTHVSARPTLTVGSKLAARVAASFFSFEGFGTRP